MQTKNLQIILKTEIYNKYTITKTFFFPSIMKFSDVIQIHDNQIIFLFFLQIEDIFD